MQSKVKVMHLASVITVTSGAVMSVSVCLFVRLLAYLRNHMDELHQIFTTRRYASAVYAVVMCLSVGLSVSMCVCICV